MTDPEIVLATLARLQALGLTPALFGGWAEEAQGLCAPRPHADIDLLLLDGFDRLDSLFAAGALTDEIAGKRFAHKRAFRTAATMVELIRVETGQGGSVTRFWGEIAHRWQAPLAAPARLQGAPVLCVTAANLAGYRAARPGLDPGRWRDPASLIAPAAR